MAGYAATPQVRKLGIKAGHTVLIENAPAGWALDDPPADAVVVERAKQADVVLSFVTAAAQVPDRIAGNAEVIFPANALWILWPRKATGHVSDVDENLIRETALGIGLVDVKVAAVDDDWSGLKLVWRKENRTR
jgi:hypothetical protein